MTEEEAIGIIETDLVGDSGILIDLSLKNGIDNAKVSRVQAAMETLAGVYKSRPLVPKRLAGAFVDLTPMFERSMSLYSPKDQERIFDLKERIYTLALEMFGVE